MLVGVPKEIKTDEFRVGLTPGAVREYIAHGHDVVVETNAGVGIGADDSAYEAAGAQIVADAKSVFSAADMIVKVKEPQAVEWAQLTEGQILYTYLHLAPDEKQTQGLLASGCSAVAYETVTAIEGGLPLLAPMSEVAGRLSIQAGAISLTKNEGGKGLLIGGVPGVKPARIVVVGGGVVGTNAARIAVGFGAEVTILDRSLPRLRQLDDLFQARVRTRYSTVDTLEEEILNADVVIGAALIPGANAPKLVTKAMVSKMQAGSVLVDVSIDQGGCFETSHATTHSDPTFMVDDIVHYCVANMPGAVPLTSTNALNNATLPYGLRLADGGLKALVEDPHFANGLNVHGGKVTHPAVAEAQGLEYVEPKVAVGG